MNTEEKEDDLISETFRSAPAGSTPARQTHSPPAGGEFCMANGAYAAQKVSHLPLRN